MTKERNIIGNNNDHLGSAAYLTDDCGQVTQTLNYLPYGEDWVDIQNNLDPRLGQYTFNGKEKDWESGFHYYGARYYWSEVLTGWLSVDPMADKYPSISPYAYCLWSPVNFNDPNGLFADDPPIKKIAKTISNMANHINKKLESAKHPTILRNTVDATAHYYYGQGTPMSLDKSLGDKLTKTKKFQEIHKKILKGETTSLSGNFGVDMTLVDPLNTFFIGDTRVDYNVSMNEDNSTCTVTYKLFSQDGFYDPNYIAEGMGNAARLISDKGSRSLSTDGKGGNLELGGAPYDFVPQERVFEFPNPGYANEKQQ